MIEELNAWDAICNTCILILEHLSHMTGLTYGTINILLFVIFGPLSTLLFCGSTLAHWIIPGKKWKKAITWTLFSLGVLIILICVIQVAIAAITLP